uniref:TPR repeat-containing protein n=1 Tax=Candidatus Kentrum sp. LFY TaxID=2126342 RepID=A0A450WWR6_9GAMM|nr:MAG: TPR repeat-containing protein [Candidatus Kentron sp. LFY]
MTNPSNGQPSEQISGMKSKNQFVSEFGAQIAVSIVLTVAVFLVGFLGLQRLGLYDKTISDLDKKLTKELSDERKLSETRRANFWDEIDKRLEEIRDTTKAVSEQYVSDAIGARQEKVLQGFDEFQKESSVRIRDIEEKLEPYRWLESRSEEVDALVGIDSIGVATRKVAELFQDSNPDVAIRVAEHALENKISGSPEDFHSLAAELGNKSLYSLASRMALRGLEHFPQNMDLLSDGILYLSASGNIETADKLVEKLRGVPKEHWNGRAFVFLGNYLRLTGRFDKAFALYEEFKRQLPHDEHAYARHGQIFQQWGKHDQAIEIFEEGLEKTRKAPTTALLLAQSYIEVGEYSKAITAIERAIEGTASSQPTANISTLFWTRAEARDALIHTNRITEQVELVESIGSAIADYQAALSMPDRIVQYAFRGPQRIQVLQLYAKNHGIDVQVNDDSDKAKAFLDLLERLGENQEDQGGEGKPR